MNITLATDVKTTKAGTVRYWTARWYDKQGRRRSKSLGKIDNTSPRAERKSKKDAERAVVLLQKEFQDTPGLADSGKAPTIEEHAKLFLERKAHTFSPKTVEFYNRAVVYLVRHFGEGRRIDNITVDGVEGFKAALASGKLKDKHGRARDLSPTSTNIYMRTAKALFQYAVKIKTLRENPFIDCIDTVKTDKNWAYISKQDFDKILEAAPPKIGVVLALCRLAGLRKGEALNLHWNNINWERGEIMIVEKDDWQPKDYERRTVPLCRELATVLLAAFENAPQGENRVCWDVYADNLTRDITAAVKRAGLLPYKKPLHTLRKNCLTDWASTMPMYVVKEWAGHANIQTTEKHYLKVSAGDFQNVSNKSFWPELTENGRNTENDRKKAPAVKQGL